MKTPKKHLNIFLLSMINISAICSIRNWPVAAEYGFSSLFLIVLAALIFFIPVALVSAELATGWPEEGGIFVWVKEAFGHKMGFLSIWYLWMTNIPWYPTLLSFIATTIAFVIAPSWVNHPYYIFGTTLILFWSATALNLCGMKISGWLSTIAVLVGTILPGIVMIALASHYWMSGAPLQITVSWSAFFPKVHSVQDLVFLTGILFSFAGIEMSSVHANDVENPQRSYPRAIFLSASMILLISALGALSIAMVIPQEKIHFTSGALDSLSYFFEAYHISFLLPLFAACIAIGSFGQMSTWIAGPSKGLLAAAKQEDLPAVLLKTNAKGMPVGLLVAQGLVVSFLALVFVFMPSINSSFWLLTALTAQYYLLLYILMFAAAIYLRYKKNDVPRSYRVPGGKTGLTLISALGMLSSTIFFLVGFIPPSQIETGSVFFYEMFLVLGMIIGSLIPSLLMFFKKSSMKTAANANVL